MEEPNKTSLSLAVATLILGLILGYWFGNSAGYARSQVDVKAAQDAAAKKAAEESVKKANPFQAVNPLQGVSANPFDKTKKALNPFQ